jgi:hypothetical protein
MASFTDSISQFNPYIQQLPVDMMTKVGMYKQAQYDQGVQKIQGYIDNISGLDISRPIDSQYLNSKLNELGGKLRTVAAGDFSNQQLVNSVGGMAAQVIKDPHIQSAVYSTSNIKKQEEVMDKARQKGELAPENEDLYNTERNKYLNSTDLGAKFDGKYIPYVDVYKILKEVAADTGIDESIIPQLFETDRKGELVMQKVKQADGSIKEQPIMNPLMAEKHLKGKSPEKIYQAFENALTPAARRQLAITGIYKNKSLTPEQLVPRAAVKYNKHIQEVSSEIDQIKLALYNEDNGDDKNLTKVQDLAEAYQNSNKVLDKLISERDKNTNIDYVTKNADAVRADLYSTDYLQGIANQMKSVASWTEYKVSPLHTIQNDNDNLALRIEEKEISINQFNYKKRRDIIADEKWAAEYYAKTGMTPDQAARQAAGLGAPGTISKPLVIEGNEIGIKHDFENDFTNDVVATNQLGLQLTKEFYKQAFPNLSDSEVDKKMYKDAAASGQSLDPNSGKQNSMTTFYANKMLAKWQNQKGGIPKNMLESVNDYSQLVKSVADKGNYIRTVEKRALEEAKASGIDVESYKNAIATVKPAIMKIIDPSIPQTGIAKRNKSVALSKEDVIDFTRIIPERFNELGSFTIDDDQESAKRQAINRLKLKFGDLVFYQLAEDLTGKNFDPNFKERLKFNKVALQSGANPEIDRVGEILHGSKNLAISKIIGSTYAKDGYVPVPVSHPILSGKDNEGVVTAKQAAIIGKYPEANEIEGYDQAKYNEVLGGKITGRYVDINMVGGVPQYDMVTVSDKGTAKVRISADDYASLGYKPYNKNETPTMFLNLNATGTTNKKPSSDARTDRTTAEWGVSQFKRTKKWDVAGDIVSEPRNPNLAYVKLYVSKKGSNEVTPYFIPVQKIIDGKLNVDLVNTPLTITDDFIDNLVKQNNK